MSEKSKIDGKRKLKHNAVPTIFPTVQKEKKITVQKKKKIKKKKKSRNQNPYTFDFFEICFEVWKLLKTPTRWWW